MCHYISLCTINDSLCTFIFLYYLPIQSAFIQGNILYKTTTRCHSSHFQTDSHTQEHPKLKMFILTLKKLKNI